MVDMAKFQVDSIDTLAYKLGRAEDGVSITEQLSSLIKTRRYLFEPR